MRFSAITTLLTCVLLVGAGLPAGAAGAPEAAAIRKAAGFEGGLVVHLGCGDGRLTAALCDSGGTLVHGLDTDPKHVAAAREHLRKLGLYGQASADLFDGKHLPYVDNLVNLLVAETLGDVGMAEVMRVLAPRGVAMIGGKKTVKPWPADIDEWTHYLHAPDNNAVARDTTVGPPRHMQWLAGPRWTRNHHKLNSVSSAVTARGRLFTIIDGATAAHMGVPGKWSVVARDAFNGVRLWTKPMKSWTVHTTRFRSGPPQVTRLLAVAGDRVYAPLGLGEPITAMDAVTGKTLRTYGDTAGAEELLIVDGTLLAVCGSPAPEHAAGHPAFQSTYKAPNQKAIVAANAETGAKLWQWADPAAPIMPETLASDGARAYVQIGEGVACLDLKSGRKLWATEQPEQRPAGKTPAAKGRKRKGRPRRTSFGRYTLVVADDVVLCNLSRKLRALSAADGRKLWECNAGGGFHSPLDIFVIDGLVWQGRHVSDSVAPAPVHDFSEGRDLHTGEVKATNTVMVDLQTAGHHHRCYREKATSRFIITGKRGIEMMDLTGDAHARNNWVRGTCQYGVLPANGLLYAPPHSCGCYMESLLWGYWALASHRAAIEQPARRVADANRLVKGPAYGAAAKDTSEDAESWPQYRHDPLRSGVAGTALPAKLAPAWKTPIGGRLTQPVAAGGRVLLAAADAGVVYALDAKSGKVVWDYAAGGRVDSPPAIHKGMALFGSADGWVTCLRLSDGALVWRFLAAPAHLSTVALDRVESLWPVHGSVLVLGGVAYCSAGRSTWLDGGIRLYALDPATGKVAHTARFQSRHPKLGEGKDKAAKEHVIRVAQNTTDYKTFLAPDLSDSFSMAGGSISDVLVSDGTNVFLHHVKFAPDLVKRPEMTRHLFSTSSLLDGTENHRSHWVLGTGDFSRIPVAYSWIANRPGRWTPGIAVPSAVMMAFTDRALWGVQRKGDATGRYHIFKKDNTPFSSDEKPLPDFRKVPKDQARKAVWQTDFPMRARAMLKTGDSLFLACTPITIPPDDPHAAYEGRLGGSVWVVSAADGSKVAEHKLDTPVVWDGMAAANGALFLSLQDGSVRCWR